MRNAMNNTKLALQFLLVRLRYTGDAELLLRSEAPYQETRLA
jgi:hypothetical protein